MRRAILVAVLAAAPLLVAFFRWEGGSLSSSDVDSFFRGRTVDGHYAVAIKKRVLGGESYLATVHGYPTNLSVCEQLVAPYNQDQSSSALGGRVLLRRATLMRLQTGIELGENGSNFPRPKGKPHIGGVLYRDWSSRPPPSGLRGKYRGRKGVNPGPGARQALEASRSHCRGHALAKAEKS